MSAWYHCWITADGRLTCTSRTDRNVALYRWCSFLVKAGGTGFSIGKAGISSVGRLELKGW